MNLPALLVEADRIANGIMHGDHALRKAGAGEKFWQFREYEHGDRPQDIDWRQSAKTQNIYIRQKEWQISQKTFFWASSAEGMFFSSDKSLPQKADVVRVITLALALLMSRADEQVGYFGNSKTGRSDGKIQQIAQKLMEDEPKAQSLPDVQSFSVPTNASVVLAGDFLDPFGDIEGCFNFLAATVENALVLQVLDPQELELNYDGRVIFQPLSGGQKETINHVASVRKDYRARIQAHIQDIYALCTASNWSYVLCRTDQDLAEVVTQIWLMLSAKGETGRKIKGGV